VACEWDEALTAVTFVSGLRKADVLAEGRSAREVTVWRAVLAYLAAEDAELGTGDVAARCNRSRSWASQAIGRIQEALDRTSTRYDPRVVAMVGRARQAIGLGQQHRMGDDLPENVVSLQAYRRSRSA
jgi:hypothetical protein